MHEYGGGAYTVDGDTVYFCNDADQRVYRVDPGGAPEPITPEPDVPFGLRYADLRVTRRLARVRARAGGRAGARQRARRVLHGRRVEPRVIAYGHDFYAAPRISPDGAQLAWLTWDHPRMPWEGTELWMAQFRDGRCTTSGSSRAARRRRSSSPSGRPDGVLHFSSDRTGWWNLYRGDYEPMTALEAEVGGPLWVFDESWYAFLADGRIVCTVFSDGTRPARGDRGAPASSLRRPRVHADRRPHHRRDARACFAGASPTREPASSPPTSTAARPSCWRAARTRASTPRYISVPRPLEYETTGGKTAHALFYPPHNPDYTAPAGERPPLMVRVHGGPTAHVTAAPATARSSSSPARGFAVVDVNYGGSTGYGREYRDRLHGQWGVVDVDDAVNAALALAEAGEVDRERMAITGGSAGGWTVLCALAFHPDVFAAGADYFGVSDLMGFVDDTHKFESRYNDWLVGPWPEAEELWRERSPVNFADRIRAPVIILQGLEDAVVPPSQSEIVVEALRANGVPFAYLAFEGEQHGFRKA